MCLCVCVKKVIRAILFCAVVFAVSCVSEGNLAENDQDPFEKNEEDVSGKDGNSVNDDDSNTGNTGNTGNSGDTGNTGNSGNSGNTGDTGNTGNTGNDEKKNLMKMSL